MSLVDILSPATPPASLKTMPRRRHRLDGGHDDDNEHEETGAKPVFPPPQEKTMAKRIKQAEAQAAVLDALTSSKQDVRQIAKATGMPSSTVTIALKALKSTGLASQQRQGKQWHWTKSAPGGPDAAPSKPAASRKSAARQAGRTPRGTAEPRFGFFSDGSVHIEAAKCAGTLTGDEAGRLVAFLTGKK
jgi:hypothetical protein